MVYKLFIDFFSPLIKRHDIQICSPGSWAPSQNICGENIKNKKSQKMQFSHLSPKLPIPGNTWNFSLISGSTAVVTIFTFGNA